MPNMGFIKTLVPIQMSQLPKDYKVTHHLLIGRKTTCSVADLLQLTVVILIGRKFAQLEPYPFVQHC